MREGGAYEQVEGKIRVGIDSDPNCCQRWGRDLAHLSQHTVRDYGGSCCELEDGPLPANKDGRIFSSPDGRAEIIISGIFHVLSHKEEVAIYLGPGEGETITYKKQGSNWIVVSGIMGNKIFHRKSILSCRDTIWNDVSIEYPAAEKEKYDPPVARVAASLREGRGYNWVTKCD